MRQLAVVAPRTKLLGADVDIVTSDEVIAFVAQAVESGNKAIVANHNLHSLQLARTDPRMATFYRTADLVEIDSMPLIFWGSLLGLPLSRRHRCTYLDWREAFWQAAARGGWRVFYLGGSPGVAEAAAQRLMSRWPGVVIETRNGFFDRTPGSADNLAVLGAINRFRPQALMVGMGMPIQEVWVRDNLDALPACPILTVGGAFDYEAGVQTAAPRLVGQLGLEWLFRLARQPRRLAARYLIEPWALIGPALADLRRPPAYGPRPPSDPEFDSCKSPEPAMSAEVGLADTPARARAAA
jgi:N-acetylglucosaminyldiphosphoundecaprenol N-acetyl-beta-D-mannosaminyltransferase